MVLAGVACVLAEQTTESHAAATTQDVPGVVSCERGGYRYEYHALSGTDALYDVRADPRHLQNIVRDHADVAGDLRRSLQAQLGVSDLSALRGGYVEAISRLRSLGYL